MTRSEILKELGVEEDRADLLTYDDWLEVFRRIPTSKLMGWQSALQQLPVEAYAAAARWIEIIGNPSKIDKLYSAQLASKENKDIMPIALGDDDEAFYEALIEKSVNQLNSSTTSTQEVARLTQNLNIFRKELHDIRARRPKEGSPLQKALSEFKKIEEKENKRKKRTTRKKGAKGDRN